MAINDLTAEYIRSIMSYEPTTGVLRWKNRRGGAAFAGDIAGYRSSGYITTSIQNRKYRGHQLAWLIYYGTPPQGQIDHINGVRDDNRLSNLRVVNNQVNAQNMTKPRSHNRSGFLGVSFCKYTGRWRATIKATDRVINIGRYDSPEEAHAAYIKTKRELHLGCTI